MGSVCSTGTKDVIKTQETLPNSRKNRSRKTITNYNMVRVDDMTIYDNVIKYYALSYVLGDGSFGIVRECTKLCSDSTKTYAVKSIKKDG